MGSGVKQGNILGLSLQWVLTGLSFGFALLASSNAMAWNWPQCRNYNGGSPEQPGTIYLGDTGTFGCDSWADVDTKWPKWRVWIKTSADIQNGTAGNWSNWSNVQHKQGTSPRFTSTGTWYWGMQVEYTDAGGTTGWYCRNDANWNNMYGTPDANLTVTVSALNNPAGVSAATNPAAASSEVKLSWTPDGSHYTMVVRKLSSGSWTEPTQGAAYSAGNTIGAGTVVYFGPAGAYTNTGLSADTSYDFKFYTENNSYYSAGVAVNGVVTMAAEPTTAPSSMTFSGATTSGMTVGWTRGNGANVLVVCRAGSAPSAGPSDLAGYSASSTFGSGTALGGGYVVYSGSGTSVTVGNLSAGTVYYFAAYEYNGSKATNYLGTALSGSRTTLSAEPTSNPAVGSFTSVGSTSMTVNWSGGNGAGYLVVMKAGGAVDGSPVDGTSYTASGTFGSGSQIGTGNRVVYLGSGTSVAVSGLTAGQTYHVAVYALNGSGGGENYLTASPGTGSQATQLAAPDTPASSVQFANVGSGSMDVSWTPGNGGNRIVVAREGSAVSWSPSDNTGYAANSSYSAGTDLGSGNKVVYNGSGSSLTVSGLGAGTAYHFKVFEYNGSDATAVYLAAGAPVASRTTLAAEPGAAASSLAFSSVTKTGLTIGWSNGGGATRLVIVRQGGAVNALPVDGTSYTANSAFGSGSQLGSGNYVVYSGSGSSVAVSGLSLNTGYSVAVVEFNGSSGTENYKTDSTLAGSQVTLDNEPVILRSPASMTVTSSVGSAPSGQAITVTNAGGSLLSYSVTDDAAWLSVSPSSGANLSTNTGTGHTASFSVGGLAAGTYSATISLASTGSGTNAAANSPQAIAVSMTLTNVGDIWLHMLTAGTPAATKYLGDTLGGGSPWYVNFEVGQTSWNATHVGVGTNAASDTGWDWGEATWYEDGTGNNKKVRRDLGAFRFTSTGSWYFNGRAKSDASDPYHYANTTDWGHSESFAPASYFTVNALDNPSVTSVAVDQSASASALVLKWSRDAYPHDVLVVRKASAGAWTEPAQGSTYNAGDTIGDGTVVYRGSATVITNSGLSAGTAYDYKFYSENWSYYSAGVTLNGTSTTETQPTTAASSLSFTAVSETGFTVNWTSGNGSSRLVLVKQGGAVDSLPVDASAYTADAAFGGGSQLGTGNYVVYSGSGSSVVVTGLSTGTAYHVTVVEFSGTGATANYKTDATLTGLQSTIGPKPVIQVSPTTITVTSSVGTAPGQQSFSVTNAGGNLLSYTLSDNASWLSEDPASGSNLGGGAGQAHAAAFTVSGLTAGTYTATMTITGTGTGYNEATNSPQTIAVSMTLTNVGDIWLHMLTAGTPAATKYLGDTLGGGSPWYVNFEVGQTSWNATHVGVGTNAASDTGWDWGEATWYEDGTGNNKKVRRDLGAFRFTSTGSWYFNGRAKSDASDPYHYANTTDWGHSESFAPASYFTVNALPDPTGASATQDASAPQGALVVSWTRDATPHDVLVVRKPAGAVWTEPVQGHAYNANDTIGAGTVVYRGSATVITNSGLSAGTTYDYKLYSENWSYYSPGVVTSAATEQSSVSGTIFSLR